MYILSILCFLNLSTALVLFLTRYTIHTYLLIFFMADFRKPSFSFSDRYHSSIVKFRNLGIVVNWSNPQRHVDDELLRYIFKNLGAQIPTQEYKRTKPLTLEVFVFILDDLHLLDGTNNQ